MEWYIAIGVIVWLALGAIAFSMFFAYFRGEFPEFSEDYVKRERREILLFQVPGGLISLIATMLFLEIKRKWHGFKWR